LRKKRIFIAHNNEELILQFSKLVDVNGVYEVKDYILNGDECKRIESFDQYDIVIVKDALTYMSGLYMIQHLLENTTQKPELIIILTPFINHFIASKCSQLGIEYRSMNISNAYGLIDLIYKYDLENMHAEKHFFDIQYEVISLLRKIGILRSYIGYSYFEYILNKMFHKGEIIYKPMKEIYQMIAQHFDVTYVSVEKAMRTCLRSSLIKNNNVFTRSVLGLSEESHDFPSTSTFIQVCIKMLKEQKIAVINNNIKRSIRKI
jgi:CheY-like chemotaxis protein